MNTTRRGRYGMVKKTTIDGITFDSKREAARYAELALLESAGRIRGLVLQPAFPIEVGGIEIRFVGSGRQLRYVADFMYYDVDRQQRVIEDAKGHQTDVYKIKRALMRAMGHDISEV